MSDNFNIPAVVGIDNTALAALGDLGLANMDALSGLSLGGFPSIRLNGTRFIAVEGDNKISLPVIELPVVFLRAAPGLRKQWYATKYDPNTADESRSPDCFSEDGVTPSAAAPFKQCETCSGCKHNAFGSGVMADGKASKGKACADTKQTAVLTTVPNKHGAENDVFGFRIPPASLKNFAGYVKSLTNRGIPLAAVITMVGFDPSVTYPVLTFKFASVLANDKIAAVVAKAKSDEVEAIINPTFLPAANARSPKADVPALDNVAAPPAREATPAATVEVVASTVEVAAPPVEVVASTVEVAAPPVENVQDTTSTDDDELRALLDL